MYAERGVHSNTAENYYGQAFDTGGIQCSIAYLVESFTIPQADLVNYVSDGNIGVELQSSINVDCLCGANSVYVNLTYPTVVAGTFIPGPPFQVAVIDPTNVQAGTPMTLTYEVQDQYGNLVTTENTQQFQIDVTGSATFAASATVGTVISGGGTNSAVVQVSGGQVIIDVNDAVQETVWFTVADSPPPDTLDYSSTQDGIFTGPPASICIFSGDGQTGTVGQPLPNPLVVMVTDGPGCTGNPTGATVNFSVTLGGGSVNPASDLTDGLGQAQTVLTLGTTAGINNNQVYAEVAGFPALNVTFTASAVPDAPYRVIILEPIDVPVPGPMFVTYQVLDQYGNLVTWDNATQFTTTVTGSASIAEPQPVTVTGGQVTITVTSPVINLPTGSTPTLTFRSWFNSEFYWDAGVVEISVNGGPFSVITPVGGYPACGLLFVPCGYSGALGGYSLQTFDLSTYAGSNVQIRFHMYSDGSVTSSGWYIDNVSITGIAVDGTFF